MTLSPLSQVFSYEGREDKLKKDLKIFDHALTTCTSNPERPREEERMKHEHLRSHTYYLHFKPLIRRGQEEKNKHEYDNTLNIYTSNTNAR